MSEQAVEVGSKPANTILSAVGKDEDELARQRLVEETKRIALETTQRRQLRAKKLIQGTGGVGQRKDGVSGAFEAFKKKGTDTKVNVDVVQEGDLTSKKQAYASNLQKFSEKGKPTGSPGTGALRQDLKQKFEKPSKEVPALFQSKPKKIEGTAHTETTLPHASAFSVIEKQETRMVGTDKHVTTTGLDHQGRRLTKTTITQSKQVGVTVSQQQKQKEENGPAPTRTAAADSNEPKEFFSLVDLRQRRVQGIDKHNREKYLSPDDFLKAFKMTKEEFYVLPKWKRDKLKRDLYLF